MAAVLMPAMRNDLDTGLAGSVTLLTNAPPPPPFPNTPHTHLLILFDPFPLFAPQDGTPVPIGWTIMAAMRNYIETVLADSVTVLTNCSVSRLIWFVNEATSNKRKEVEGLYYKMNVCGLCVYVFVFVCVCVW